MLLALLFVACGQTEEPAATTAEPSEPAAAEPEPEPAPPPEPEPPPVADCPADAWSVATNDVPNRAAATGVEAAGWVRAMGPSFTRLRVCRHVGEDDVRLSCAPIQGGAECELALAGNRHCTGTIPGAALPIAVGQLIDTQAQPEQGSWRCSRR